jgi:FHA domain/Domain of unknown function (DUF1707)
MTMAASWRPPAERTRPVRPSDADRDRAISELRERFAEGRLTPDTFAQRLDVALHARAHKDLAELLQDLPARRWQPGPLAAAAAAWLTRAAARITRPRPAGGTPQRLTFPRGAASKFTIGRALECDFVLADPSVSRFHARLHREPDGWLLRDLGSTNGTMLNGWRVTEPVSVRPGDRVSFGLASFLVGDA